MARGPTIDDVAQLAGVSNMTVSRVANNSPRVSGKTREKVLEAMASLDYRPNAIAQGMRSNSTRTVGFLLPDLTNPLNAMITQAVETSMAEEGYRMLVASTRFDIERELFYIEQFQRNMVDGMIALLSDETSERIANAISKSRMPVVVIDRDLPVPVDAVLCDHHESMAELVNYLAAQGHRRIAMMNGPMSMRPARQRDVAYRKTAEMLGLREALVDIVDAPPTIEEGYLRTLDLFHKPVRPTALIVCSNQSMFGALRALKELGLSIPDDVSFVGADEGVMSPLYDPPLTILTRDVTKMGHGAAELLVERLRNPRLALGRTFAVRAQIVHRDSCGPPRTP